MSLTYKLDRDILPLDLHAEIQVCMSVRFVVRVVTHRHTQTMSKLLHRRVGCNDMQRVSSNEKTGFHSSVSMKELPHLGASVLRDANSNLSVTIRHNLSHNLCTKNM